MTVAASAPHRRSECFWFTARLRNLDVGDIPDIDLERERVRDATAGDALAIVAHGGDVHLFRVAGDEPQLGFTLALEAPHLAVVERQLDFVQAGFLVGLDYEPAH